jgi:hypothetical protein
LPHGCESKEGRSSLVSAWQTIWQRQPLIFAGVVAVVVTVVLVAILYLGPLFPGSFLLSSLSHVMSVKHREKQISSGIALFRYYALNHRIYCDNTGTNVSKDQIGRKLDPNALYFEIKGIEPSVAIAMFYGPNYIKLNYEFDDSIAWNKRIYTIQINNLVGTTTGKQGPDSIHIYKSNELKPLGKSGTFDSGF